MASERLNPVAWTEGMFLRPQHLQHRDLYAEERLRYHFHALDPFHWGVREFAVNEEALSENRLEILRLDAVMPGGTIVRYPGNAVVETREFDPEAQSLDVFVGLRRLRPSEPNAAPAENGARDVRYLLRSNDVPDLVAGGSEAPVELAYPNVRVFVSGEEHDLEVHETFRLARVVATGELKEPFALAPNVCPPLLAVQAFPPLVEEISRIVAQLAAKVRVVAGRTETQSIADLPRMWMRYTLARRSPLLRHLLSTGQTHPFALYTELVETAASLAAFNMLEPAQLPTYEHDDLQTCFGALIAFIDEQLGEAVPDRFQEIKLEYDAAKKVYATDALNTDLVAPRNLYYLGVKAALDSKDLVARVVEEGKAGSKSGVQVMVITNTAGVPIEHLPAAPTEIASRAGFEYFKLESHNPKWAKVREDFTFALSLPKVESADIRLYVVAGG